MAADLTRAEAGERARLVRPTTTTVELDLSTGPDTFRSVTTLLFTCREPGASTFLELVGPAVHEVVLNGRPLDVASVWNGERIRLADLRESNEVRVVADCAYSRTGEGLHRFVDTDGGVYLYTQFEPYDAHRMYACFDQPDLKTVFVLTVRAPEGWEVVSNSRVAQTEDGGEGTTVWRFAETPVVSTYVTAVVAGNYSVVRDHHDGIDLGIYCRQAVREFLDPEEILTVTRQGFDFYHRAFDYRYPFDKYDQLFVPEFNMGAMENVGCVTFLDDYVFRSKVTDARRERRGLTILHEMAHMWFGDLVTMRWWDDLWLNESFAEYISTLCQAHSTRWTGAWTTFCNSEKTWAYRADQLSSTHPIAADAPDVSTAIGNFDGITYAKGAAVLKQLVAWVGQEEFLTGVRSYFRRHEYGNTSLRDLLDSLEDASGRPLGAWSKEWLGTTGVNTLRPRFETDSSGLFTSFDIAQEATEAHPTLRSHRVAVGLYDRTDDGLVRRERVELDVVGPLTEVPALVGARQPDLVLVNDDDLTYAKIRLDRRSLETLIDGIGDIRESLPRTLCWQAAWDMCRDAEMPARDFVRLVLSGIDGEDDIGVVQNQLGRAHIAVTSYADPTWAAEGRRMLASAALDRMRSRPAGSDEQLAFANVLAGNAVDRDHVEVLRDLLAGRDVPPGLVLDAELRWTLLTRLVVLGVAGTDEIEAELARDRTAEGEKRAARARAARPTPEAKAEAWRLVVTEDALSNHLRRETVAGWAPTEHAELVRPYVERYFEALPEIWRTRSMEGAMQLSQGLYPSVLVEPGIVARTDAYLASAEPETALRRVLLEGRDDLVRALRARECDARAAG